MGMEDGTLYVMMGDTEQPDKVTTWKRRMHGWSWGEISKGYNQSDQPRGFGRTVLAIDPTTKKVLWHHRED